MTINKNVLWASIVLTVLFLLMSFSYREEIFQYRIRWKESAEIVMFGDSHTAHGKWNFTLHTNPVLRSGWAGYTSDMLVDKIPSTISYNPKFVFILCGGNDIYQKDFSVKNTIVNYRLIADILKKNNITPIFQKLMYQHNNPEFNKIIDSINMDLTNYCKKEQIDLIDIGNKMYDSKGLRADLTIDNLHLNQKGYDLWSVAINDYLKNK